jgi:hypothetical protein
MVVARTLPSVEMVRFFMAQDPACVEDADASGSLPIHVAVSKSGNIRVELDLVQVLVEARPGALLAADATGSLPFHAALQQPGMDLDLVRYLVEQQPQALQHKNSGGMLPMRVAAAPSASSAPATTKGDGNNKDAAASAASSSSAPATTKGDANNKVDDNDAPLDVLFYLASKCPQAVFGGETSSSVASCVASTTRQQPCRRSNSRVVRQSGPSRPSVTHEGSRAAKTIHTLAWRHL